STTTRWPARWLFVGLGPPSPSCVCGPRSKATFCGSCHIRRDDSHAPWPMWTENDSRRYGSQPSKLSGGESRSGAAERPSASTRPDPLDGAQQEGDGAASDLVRGQDLDIP